MQNQYFIKDNNLELETSSKDLRTDSEVRNKTGLASSRNHKASFEEETFEKTSNSIQEEITSSKILEKPQTEALCSASRSCFEIQDTLQPLEKVGVSYACPKLNQCPYRSNQLRGGAPEENVNENTSAEYSELIVKFQQHKESILKDSKLERELNLFIKIYTHSQQSNEDCKEPIELGFDVQKNLLSTESPQVLLLTGQAGIGKSFFCKNLQREILLDWNVPQTVDKDENSWFPIYFDFSTLKNPKSEAISETLERELHLTHSEILLLQTAGSNNFNLPQLLFIFDGYDSVGDTHILNSLKTIEDFKAHNFCTLNRVEGEFWKNTKFVITCREEHLRRIQRRDLLFAPLNQDSHELAIIPGSFLERKLEPFSDEQITCYLKRYCWFENIDIIQEREKEAKLLGLFDSKQSAQWKQVENFERLMDNYKLREMARIPCMLWIISQTLSKITVRGIRQNSEMNEVSNRLLVDLLVNEALESHVQRKIISVSDDLGHEQESKKNRSEKELDLLIKKIVLRLQSLALKLRGHPYEPRITEDDIDEGLLLESYLLVEWDERLSRIRFRCSLLSDFFFAKSIEEELSKIDPLSISQSKEVFNKLILNQCLLSDQIILFLRDVITDKRLTTNLFLNLIHLSRETNDDYEKLQGSKQSHFSIGAANSITILNSTGYDFSKQDLSNISIPGANLSYGIFEGTKFHNSNLENVDFTGAWLKNAQFLQSNLKNIEFGEISSLKLEREQIANIGYSESGKYLAVGLSDETVLFESIGVQKFCLKEMRRVSGYFLNWRKELLNMNREQLITVDRNVLLALNKQSKEGRKDKEEEDSSDREQNENIFFYLWDAASGQSIEKLDIPIGKRKFLSFHPTTREVIAFDGKSVQKYDISSNSWIDFQRRDWKDPIGCNVSGRNTNMLLVGDFEVGILGCDLQTGEILQKQRQAITNCKLSLDGKKIVSRINTGVITISDCIRGYPIKFQTNKSNCNDSNNIESCAFNLDGKQIVISTKDALLLQDAADAKLILSIPLKTDSQGENYSFNPSRNQIVFLAEKGTVSFIEPSVSEKKSTARGINNKGFNVQETVVCDCIGLSIDLIEILKERGEYGQFNESTGQSLFPSTSGDSQNVRVVSSFAEKLGPIHAKIIGSNLHWINLQKLDLSRNNIDEEGGEVIASNRFWINLEELILLNANIGDRTAMAIANNQAWKNLKMVQLGSNRITNKGAEAIGNNKIWVNLEILDLHQNDIGDSGALIISTNICWEKLTSLNLSSNKISDKDTIVLLCDNNTWKNLKRLMLHDNPFHLKEQDVFKLIDGIPSQRLELLNLPKIFLGQKLLHILKYSAPQEMTELSLKEDECNEISTVVIARDISWINLKILNLSNNQMDDEVGVKIGSNIAWVNLEDLDLSGNSLGPESGIAIGNNKSWSKLKTLNLNNNNMNGIGISQIAKNTTWINLQSIELGNNMIGDEGTTELSKNTAWVNLQRLILWANMLSAVGVAELCKNTTWIDLKVLNLSRNKICSNGAAELSKDQTWTKLETLNLSATAIEDKGAIELSKNTSWTNLKMLNLKYNSINSEGAAELSKNITWKDLQTLELSSDKFGAEGAKGLSKNTNWTKLKILNLSKCSLDAAGITELCKSTIWADLKTLSLLENNIGSIGVSELCKNKTWTKLENLDLSYNNIEDEGAIELSKNTTWTNLKSLYLWYNAISPKGASELSTNMAWKNLKVLNLSTNSMNAEMMRKLSENSTWKNLTTLNLGMSSIYSEITEELSHQFAFGPYTIKLSRKIGSKGAMMLGQRASWNNLESFDLSNSKIDSETVSKLCENSTWINLQKLNLSKNLLGGEGAFKLSKNSTWANLKELDLSSNSLGFEGAIELSKNTSWKNLEKLKLASNGIGPEGAAELSQSVTWINLKDLDLSANNIGPDGSAKLSKNTTWINLQDLNLSDNSLGLKVEAERRKDPNWIHSRMRNLNQNSLTSEGVAKLSQNKTWINLRRLNLNENLINDKGAAELSKNTTWIHLKMLSLMYNSIGDQGAAELSQNTSWRNLQSLDLGRNSIGDQGVAELSKNISWKKLNNLNLSGNLIGPKGAIELSKNKTWTNLRTLDLSSNEISDSGAIELAKNITWNRLQELWLDGNEISTGTAEIMKKNPHWPEQINISI